MQVLPIWLGSNQDVLLKRVTLDAAVAALADPGERQLAYEMAAGAATAAAAAAGPVVVAQPNVTEAELDKSILNYALMNGALELLPQSWASMAIIPLQIKMVYSIGKAHGVQLDQGHIMALVRGT